jgi:hypothetical protein
MPPRKPLDLPPAAKGLGKANMPAAVALPGPRAVDLGNDDLGFLRTRLRGLPEEGCAAVRLIAVTSSYGQAASGRPFCLLDCPSERRPVHGPLECRCSE